MEGERIMEQDLEGDEHSDVEVAPPTYTGWHKHGDTPHKHVRDEPWDVEHVHTYPIGTVEHLDKQPEVVREAHTVTFVVEGVSIEGIEAAAIRELEGLFKAADFSYSIDTSQQLVLGRVVWVGVVQAQIKVEE